LKIINYEKKKITKKQYLNEKIEKEEMKKYIGLLSFDFFTSEKFIFLIFFTRFECIVVDPFFVSSVIPLKF
jgi:hypothetical protein